MPGFGNILRLLRIENKLSQQELSQKLGISKSAVNMYERSERQPNFETLELIADYFNVDMDYLLGRSGIKKKIHIDEHGNEHINIGTSNQEPTYEDVELLIARNGKKMSKEQKLKLIQMLSEI